MGRAVDLAIDFGTVNRRLRVAALAAALAANPAHAHD